MDRLDAMAVFLEVVKAGSLSAAGRNLRQPLATVSRKIAELEAHLNTQLFIRANRRLNITPAGAEYAASAKRILDEIAEVERAASGEYVEPRGELVITAPMVFGRLHVLPVVNDFLKTYPAIQVRLHLADRVSELVSDGIDLAIRIAALPDSSLMATRLGFIRHIACASPAYLQDRAMPLAPQDLLQHDCINFGSIGDASHWTFGTRADHQTVEIHCRLVVNTAEAAIDAALAGIGITRVLSYQAEKPIRAGRLVTVLRDFEPDPVPVHMIYAARDRLPQKLRSFIDFAAPRLKDALQIASL